MSRAAWLPLLLSACSGSAFELAPPATDDAGPAIVRTPEAETQDAAPAVDAADAISVDASSRPIEAGSPEAGVDAPPHGLCCVVPASSCDVVPDGGAAMCASAFVCLCTAGACTHVGETCTTFSRCAGTVAECP